MQTYCIRQSIPIFHGNSGDRERAHCHTIEIAAHIQKKDGQFERFSDMERRIKDYFDRYDDQFLNAMPEFETDASIENIGEVFFAGLTEVLERDGFMLSRLEVGETPLRQYIIGLLDG